MSTVKSRINITAGRDIERALIKAAKRDQVPVATKAAELLRLGLEIEEDLILGQIAEERLADKKARYITHEQAWA